MDRSAKDAVNSKENKKFTHGLAVMGASAPKKYQPDTHGMNARTIPLK
jgi:hypothetical protein